MATRPRDRRAGDHWSCAWGVDGGEVHRAAAANGRPDRGERASGTGRHPSREQDRELGQRDAELQRRAHEIQFKDAKIEKITFELAHFKRWKLGAKSEAMSAEQRRLFEETCAEDEAALQAQLDELRGQRQTPDAQDDKPKCRSRREPLPEHLRRV